MPLDPKDPFFEGALTSMISQKIDGSQLASIVRQLQGRTVLPLVLTAARPASPVAGQLVFVSDGAAGAKFQGWDGSSWVNLG